MIVIAIVRGVSTAVYGPNDQIWTTFWIQPESSVSVVMVSLTASRTLFVVNRNGGIYSDTENTTTTTPPIPNENLTLPRNWWSRVSQRSGARDERQLLPIVKTGATLTGLRTMIRERWQTVNKSRATIQAELEAPAARSEESLTAVSSSEAGTTTTNKAWYHDKVAA